MNKIIFTCGDINGIGPEICIKTINKIYSKQKRNIVFICPKNVLLNTAGVIEPKFNFTISKKYDEKPLLDNNVLIIDTGQFLHTPGIATKDSGLASYKSLVTALKIIRSNSDCLITAPISKQALQSAGINYPGHTEIIAKHFKSKKYQMLFLSKKMICGLVTIHEPIKKIPGLITRAGIKNSISILNESLIGDLKIKNPKIAVLGLNPHAGENGKIGDEELKTIIPAIDSLKQIDAAGPFVPDAFFANHLYKKFDAVLGMYHDQVLIPFKMMN